MLKTYLFAIIIGLQAAIGLNVTASMVDNHPGYDSQPIIVSAQAADTSGLAGAANEKTDALTELQKMGITLHPGKDFTADSNDDPKATLACASLVYKTLQVMPAETVKQIKNLTLYFNATGRRGLGGGSTIILRCQNVSDEELVGVLVHELGHIEDTGVLKGTIWAGESEFKDGQAPIYQDDASLDFYRISFQNDHQLLDKAQDADFVSGYAMSDPFEDFAETYNFYVLHGQSFRQMKINNTALAAKYAFMKDEVFKGREFDNDIPDGSGSYSSRHYDSTVLGFNLKNFLAYS